jgi:C1A family cysteine protease
VQDEYTELTLPASIDWRHLCSAIRDQVRWLVMLRSVQALFSLFDIYQGQEGSCTAFAATGLFEFRENQLQTSPFWFDGFQQTSPQFVYYTERQHEHSVNKDSGANVADIVYVMQQVGVCKESTWPYLPGRPPNGTEFTKPPPTASQEAAQHKVQTIQPISSFLGLKSALYDGNPFVFDFKVYESFEVCIFFFLEFFLQFILLPDLFFFSFLFSVACRSESAMVIKP